MPIGEVRQVEHVAAPVLALDDGAGTTGDDRDDLGYVSVDPTGAAVVAGELNLVAITKLLLNFCECLVDVRAPAGGLPYVTVLGRSRRGRADEVARVGAFGERREASAALFKVSSHQVGLMQTLRSGNEVR